MTRPAPDQVDDGVRTSAKAAAWAVLNRIRSRPAGRAVGRATNATARVRVTIEPPDLVAGRDRPRVGRWLSPTCLLIVTKLGDATLSRVELAKRCQMTYDPKFKTLVNDLLERGILEEPEEGGGVRVAKERTG
jgi:hypothetical protein